MISFLNFRQRYRKQRIVKCQIFWQALHMSITSQQCVSLDNIRDGETCSTALVPLHGWTLELDSLWVSQSLVPLGKYIYPNDKDSPILSLYASHILTCFVSFCLGVFWSLVHRFLALWSRCLVFSPKTWLVLSCVRPVESMAWSLHFWWALRRRWETTGLPCIRILTIINWLRTRATLHSGLESP